MSLKGSLSLAAATAVLAAGAAASGAFALPNTGDYHGDMNADPYPGSAISFGFGRLSSSKVGGTVSSSSMISLQRSMHSSQM